MPEDKRIVKTRALLRAALQQLMETVSFDDIKVKQICKKSNVSRMTFYSHFSDKYALLDNLYDDFLARVMQRCIDKCRKNGEKDDVRAYSVNLYVSYAEELYDGRMPFFRAVFDERGYSFTTFTDFITHAARDLIRKIKDCSGLSLSDEQLMSLLCYGPMDFLRSTAYSENIEPVRAAEICRSYYSVAIDFALDSADAQKSQ